MKPFSNFFGSLVALYACLALAPPVGAQDPIPLDQPFAEPLSTPAISEFDVELFGKLAHLWTLPDGTEVIQFYGEFALHMGPRRLSSRDAVVWMKQDEYESRLYRRFEVFLWRDARVVEPGGSVTTGPVLFITLQSFGDVSANYDVQTRETSADSPLYLRADRVRRSLSPYRTPLYARETPLEVQRPADDGEEVGRKDRQPIMIRPGKRMVTVAKGDERLIVAAGGVYIARGAPRSAEFLEIRSQDAVLFLRESSLLSRVEMGLEDDDEPSDADLERALEDPMPEPGAEPQTGPQGLDVGSIGELLSAVYLEGDVILSRGERMIRANRLFYDLQNDRALILDAVMRAPVPGRNLPIYVRAETVRQLSAREYEARNAIFSTSEFHTPHYAIGADRIILYDRTLGPPDSQITGLVAGTYKAYDTSIRVEGVPVSYWPYTRGDFKQGESVLQGVSMGYRENFGAVIESQWDLSTLLGLEPPEGFKSSLLLDYYSDRGPGAGINLDYKRDDYYGLLRTYYINDEGTDDFGGFRDDVEVLHDNRGRGLWRHRQYLPRDWELTLEVSYISDSNFLESYFEREFDTGKEQETLIYLKKQHDNWAVTGLAKWKILSWIQTTESLPDIAFHWIGQPLGETASYFNESRFGNVRFRQDERLFFESRRLDNLSETDVTFRGDTRHEIDVPFSLGPVKVVPYGVVRGGAWDGDEVGRGGSIQRIFGQAGLRSSMYFWRVFPDVRSRLFDINGLRHLITPTVTAWVTGTNRNADELTPFTETVETIGSFSGVNVGVRQRLQTKRGAGDDQRVVDWMVLDIQTGFFDHDRIQTEFTRGWISSTRPEDSITSNFLRAEYLWRISDTTALLSDVIFDLNSGSVGSLDASLAVERTPRFSYFVGYRYIGEIKSNLLGVGVNYRISRKHTLAIRDYFDLDRGENGGFELAYIRKFPRWYVGVTFEFDNVKDQTSLSLSAWPEGLPSMAIGGRRYTGVADTVAIGE